MKLFMLAIATLLLAGCGSLPSMKYCDSVSYTRTGTVIHIEADCRTTVGAGIGLI
jgi:type IV pilus biogenesis protein CpaD/CtpE